MLAPGQCGNVLQVFEDKPMGNDAWDIEIYYQEKMRVIDGLTCFEVKECGSVRLVLHMGWKYMNSTIDQDVILYVVLITGIQAGIRRSSKALHIVSQIFPNTAMASAC